jgi:hypothetical protein
MLDIVILSIFFNFFTCLLLFVLLISLGKNYKSFAIFNGAVCIWSIFYGLSAVSDFKDNALIFYRLTSVALVFIPYSFFKFAIDASGFSKSKIYPAKIRKINNIIALILGILMTTPLMIYDAKDFLGFKFVPKITPIFYLYHIYYSVLVICGLKLLYKSSKNNYKNKGLFVGFTIGFIGGTTTLFPFMGLPIYPIGIPLVSIYSSIVTYVIVKHRVFDGSTAFTKLLIRIIGSFILLSLFIAIITIYDLVVNISSEKRSIKLLFVLVFFLVSLELYQVLVFRLNILSERLGWGMSYNKKQILLNIEDRILSVVSLEQLDLELKNIIENDIGIQIKSFFICKELKIIDKNEIGTGFINCFGDKVSEENLSKLQIEIESDNKFNLSIKYNEMKASSRALMDKMNSKGFVPFLFQRKLKGFLLVEGRVKKRNFFFYEDMEIFDDLVYQQIFLYIDI